MTRRRSLGWRRLLSAGLCVVVALAGATAAAAPAQAVTWLTKLCTSFAGCNAQGRGNAGYQDVYTQSFWNMYGGHNCTNYVAYRMGKNGVAQFTIRGQGNAMNWGAQAKAAGWAVDRNNPKQGDIAWFDAAAVGGVGHVAYVESVDLAAGKVVVSEDNYGGDFDWRPYKISDVSGFIHTGKSEPPPPPDSDGDGVPDKDDKCPTVPGSNNGCPRLQVVEALSIKAPSGWYRNAPIVHTFTVKNTTSAPLSVGLLILAVRDASEKNLDQLCAANLVLQAGATKKCSITATWNSVGKHRVWPDWLDKSSGKWHANQMGPGADYSLSATPALLAVEPLTISAPSGWYQNAPIVHNFAVKNTTSAPIKMRWLIVAARDAAGKNVDQPCAVNEVLAAGATKKCSVTAIWSASGRYSVYLDWGDLSERWHGGELGPTQSYAVAAASPLAATPTPSISGTAKVGSTLTAASGIWQPAPVSLAYQWYRSGTVISGATKSSYTLVAADQGASVSVKVTGSKPGYLTVGKTSAGVTVQAADPVGQLATTPVPKISGSVKVGKKLTAKPGTWKPSGVALAYQWFRSGVPIEGATSKTYTLAGADKGKRITVKVTGAKSGYASVTKASKATKKVAAGTLTKGKPKISGAAKVGRTLTVRPGAWKPAAVVTLTYQWYRNGKKISGATEATYLVTSKDKGKKLAVTVTGRATGYATASRTSSRTRKVT